MIYNFHSYGIILVYNVNVLINLIIKILNANIQHQSSIVILMMIQQYLANKLQFAMLQ